MDGESAEVDTRVVGRRGTPIKIEYKLNLTGGQWMVYDAVIDDVSVVGNYRSQFARVLQTGSLEELIQNSDERHGRGDGLIARVNLSHQGRKGQHEDL